MSPPFNQDTRVLCPMSFQTFSLVREPLQRSRQNVKGPRLRDNTGRGLIAGTQAGGCRHYFGRGMISKAPENPGPPPGVDCIAAQSGAGSSQGKWIKLRGWQGGRLSAAARQWAVCGSGAGPGSCATQASLFRRLHLDIATRQRGCWPG